MVKIFFCHLKQNIKSELEYKASFIMGFISSIFLFFTYYFVILGLFSKFSNVSGFTLYEVLLCFGIIHFGYATNESFFSGLDKFEDFIIDGSLDRLLLRPQTIIFQVLSSRTSFSKVSRMLQSVIIIVIAIIKLKIKWTILKVITLLGMIISAIVIFFGLFLLTASYCFYTVHGLEIKNVFTDGGKFMSQYPIGIFRKGFIFIFTFIIPYAFVNYYPLLYFIGKSTNDLAVLSPLIIFLYLIPPFAMFQIGLKHYNSVGS